MLVLLFSIEEFDIFYFDDLTTPVKYFKRVLYEEGDKSVYLSLSVDESVEC